MTSNYYIIVSDGLVFEGSLSSFKEKVYAYPDDWTEDQILDNIRDWASNNNWTVDITWCH